MWQSPSHRLIMPGTMPNQTTRSECADFAHTIGVGSENYDFYPDRACSQAVRCQDAACTNLEGETRIPP